jgi:preprotein translocase subunit SecF
MRKYRKMPILALLNQSLNETLSRTMVTSLSIMLALAVLLALGPDVVRPDRDPARHLHRHLSIYISAPALVWLGLASTASSATRKEDRTVALAR